MDLADARTRAAVTARLGAAYAGRPVIVAPGVLAAATTTVAWMRELGSRVLVLSTTRGAGPVPGPPDCEVVEVASPPTASVTEEMRVLDRLTRNLPPHAVDAVERFDPERRGVWLASPFVTSDTPVLGRPVVGGRPAAFLALEDKLLAEEVWAAAGVRAAPHRVVPVDDPGALAAASAEVAGPLGAVWSGDARDGFNGGGNYVRWVTGEHERTAARAFFAPRCDRVRVQPFLDGVPCSIHGVVLPDGTAAFRPVEIAVLRDAARHRLVYGGPGTTWDPPDADRDEMRAVVHRVGAHLQRAHGYRGAFGVDGVLTADGFLPTELNTRMSAGLAALAVLDARFFTFLQHALLAGVDTGLGAADLETLVPLMDAVRLGKVVAFVEGVRLGRQESYPVAWDGAAFHRAGAETGSTLALGHTPSGTFVRVEPCTALVPGRRLAEVNRALATFVDRTYGASLGALTIAPDLRGRLPP